MIPKKEAVMLFHRIPNLAEIQTAIYGDNRTEAQILKDAKLGKNYINDLLKTPGRPADLRKLTNLAQTLKRSPDSFWKIGPSTESLPPESILLLLQYAAKMAAAQCRLEMDQIRAVVHEYRHTGHLAVVAAYAPSDRKADVTLGNIEICCNCSCEVPDTIKQQVVVSSAYLQQQYVEKNVNPSASVQAGSSYHARFHPDLRSVTAAPIIRDKRAIGVVCIDSFLPLGVQPNGQGLSNTNVILEKLAECVEPLMPRNGKRGSQK